MSDADSFLSFGGPALKFPEVGTKYTFTVSGPPEMRQQEDYDTGEPLWLPNSTPENPKPKMQMVLPGTIAHRAGELPAGDDGERRLFIARGIQSAMKLAMKQSRTGHPYPLEGGVVTIERVADGAQTDKKKKAPHQFEASYTPPATANASAADFLGGGGGNSAPASKGRGKVTVPDDEEPPF